MTIYTVADSVGSKHTVTADHYVPETGPGGDARVIVFHFMRSDGTRAASFVNPRSVTTGGFVPVRPQSRVRVDVNGHVGDVTRLLKQWADQHGYKLTDMTVVAVGAPSEPGRMAAA